MGFLILVMLGALIGWIGTIILRIEDQRGILINIGAGIAGSLIASIAFGQANIFGAIGPIATLWALGGAIAFVAIANMVRSRVLR